MHTEADTQFATTRHDIHQVLDDVPHTLAKDNGFVKQQDDTQNSTIKLDQQEINFRKLYKWCSDIEWISKYLMEDLVSLQQRGAGTAAVKEAIVIAANEIEQSIEKLEKHLI